MRRGLHSFNAAVSDGFSQAKRHVRIGHLGLAPGSMGRGSAEGRRVATVGTWGSVLLRMPRDHRRRHLRVVLYQGARTEHLPASEAAPERIYTPLLSVIS